MRFRLTGQRWLFWGERLRQPTNPWNDCAKKLAAPWRKPPVLWGSGARRETVTARFPEYSIFVFPIIVISRALARRGDETDFRIHFCSVDK